LHPDDDLFESGPENQLAWNFSSLPRSRWANTTIVRLWIWSRLFPSTYFPVHWFIAVGWEWIHLARRSLCGLLYQPRMIDVMSVAKPVEWVAWKTEVLGEHLLQCRVIHHKFHMTWPGLEPGPPRREAID
jgi:hypothetical protein